MQLPGMPSYNVVGLPGAGKSMAARRLPTILPGMTWDECLEVSEIYSAAGLLKASEGLITSRPFRSPHHTASDVALGRWGQSAQTRRDQSGTQRSAVFG